MTIIHRPTLVIAIALAVQGCTPSCCSCVDLSPVGFTCKDIDDVDSVTAEAIDEGARQILALASSGDHHTLHGQSHPKFKRAVSQKSIEEAMRYITPRIGGADAPELVDLRLVEFTGSVPAAVICGAVTEDDPTHLVFNPVKDAPPKVAIVSYRYDTSPQAYTLTVKLWPDSSTWKLAHVALSTHAYEGRLASDYIENAATHEDNGEVLTAFFSLAMAHQLSSPADYLITSERKTVDARVAALQATDEFVSASTSWKVDGVDFPIHKLMIISTLKQIAPKVQYLSEAKLTREEIDPEAARLHQHLLESNPSMEQQFGAVVYEAFNKPPTNANTVYPSFTAVLPDQDEESGSDDTGE